MVFQPSIQTYAGAHTTQSIFDGRASVDWHNGLIFIGSGDLTSPNASKSALVGGAELAWVPLSSFADPVNNVSIGFVGDGIGWDGQLYETSGEGLSRIDPSNLTRQDTWGADPWIIFPPGLPTTTPANSLGGPIAVIRTASGQKFILGCGVSGTIGNFNAAYLAKLPNFAGLTFSWATTSISPVACNGPDLSGFGYVGTSTGAVGDPAIYRKITCLDGGTWVPANWPTPNPQMSVSVLASILPTDVNGAWTVINSSGGICVDSADGHLLAFVQGDANAIYMLKINSSSGAIIWKSAIPGNRTPGAQMACSSVQHSRYYLMSQSPAEVITINTTDGSFTTSSTGLAGVTPGPQCSNDDFGAIVLNCAFVVTGGGPTLLGSSTGPFNGWAALYVAPGILPTGGRRLQGFLGLSRVKKAGVAPDVRVTEDGDTRVTEAGDVRILQ